MGCPKKASLAFWGFLAVAGARPSVPQIAPSSLSSRTVPSSRATAKVTRHRGCGVTTLCPPPHQPQNGHLHPTGLPGPRAGDLHGAGGFAWWGEQGAGGALRGHVCPSLRLHRAVFACRCVCVCLHTAGGVCTAPCVSVRPRWVLASRGAGRARAVLAAPCAGACASCAGLGVGARRGVCCSWRAACPAQPGCFVPSQDVLKAASCPLHPGAARRGQPGDLPLHPEPPGMCGDKHNGNRGLTGGASLASSPLHPQERAVNPYEQIG